MMQQILALAALASTLVVPAVAVNMALYKPETNVDVGFQSFLKQSGPQF